MLEPSKGRFEFAAEAMGGPEDSGAPLRSNPTPPDRCVGLGTGVGGQIARAGLGISGLGAVRDAKPVIDMTARKSDVKTLSLQKTPRSEGATPRRGNADSMLSYSEPKGMWLALLLNDMGPVAETELGAVSGHRWTYQGAVELAGQGRSICFFIWCLLELQRNIQMDEAEILNAKLIEACKTFVKCQCREGRMGDMYQVLTHFISNSAVFYEWERYLTGVFQDSRAKEERWLVSHLTEVWSRYNRLKSVLESIFDCLDSHFVWRHRLPKVGELVHQHMKRRCFSSPIIAKNELFSSQQGRDETLKQVKFAFGLS